MKTGNKKVFTPQADQELLTLVTSTGDNDWQYIAARLPYGFTPRQCRDRWKNYLDPQLDRSTWTEDEDSRLLSEYDIVGAKWVAISANFPGRAVASVRNRCITMLRKRDRITGQSIRPESGVGSIFAVAESPFRSEADHDDVFDFVLSR